MFHHELKTAVILMTAVLLVSACATKRDVMRVEEKVNSARTEQQTMMAMITHLDSLVAADADDSNRLRAEVRSTLGELLEQFRMIQASMNDLTDKVNYVAASRGGQTVVLPPPADSTDTADTTAAVIPGINCQDLYDESFINIRRGQYEEAVRGFSDYLQYCGGQDLADNARFWIGEAQYSMEKYREAIEEFKKLIDKFPNSEKRPGAMYKSARSYEELGQKNDARTTFQKLIDDYPGTLEAEQAKEKLKELK